MIGLANPDHKLRFGEQTLHKSLNDFSYNIRLENSFSHLDTDLTMGGIRKLLLTY
jgi:hypothetical protein